MSNPVLSVIIPVFNGEAYVERAALSVLDQPCGDSIEMIIVDDGSTDRTGVICDELANTYRNVKVIHKINGGVSIARNTGIDAANGKYLAFLDADDWWSPGIFDEKLIELIIQQPADLIAFGMRKVSSDFKYYKEIPRKAAMLSSGKKAEQFHHCSYFFDANMVKGLGIRFPIAKRWEDPPFVNLSTYFAKSTRCINAVLYNYWMNQSSVTHTDMVKFYLPEQQKAFIQERQAFSRLGVEYNNDRVILSMIVSLLPRLCVENRYIDVKRITDEGEYNLLHQDEIQPWSRLQPVFRLWRSHPVLFYIKSQIHPGIMLRIKWLFQKTPLTRRLSDWIQYHLIEKWVKV